MDVTLENVPAGTSAPERGHCCRQYQTREEPEDGDVPEPEWPLDFPFDDGEPERPELPA
jgi:hypothetical protein